MTTHWETPPEFRCDGCGKKKKGTSFTGSDRIVRVPPIGWTGGWDGETNLVRGALNSCLVEFQDGYRVVTSRNFIRKMEGAKP